MGNPILAELGEVEGFAERLLHSAADRLHHGPAHYATATSANGAHMSLTSIADVLEQAEADYQSVKSKAIGDLRGIATAVDNDPLVQGALSVAAEVAPEVRAAAAALLPDLTGVDPSLIGAVTAAVRAVISAYKGAAPAAPPAG